MSKRNLINHLLWNCEVRKREVNGKKDPTRRAFWLQEGVTFNFSTTTARQSGTFQP